MTDPAPGTDPATPPADPANPPADPPATDPADPPADPADDGQGGDDDARVKRANQQAAKYRTDLRAAQDQLTKQGETLAALAAVFNPDAGASTDPAEQLATITSEAETLRSRTAQLEAELLVHTLAPEHTANATALLDSRTFTNKLIGLDPTSDDYRDQVAQAIKDAVAGNSSLSAGQVPSRGGAPGAGQGSEQPAGTVTQEQFSAMSYRDRARLFQTNPELYRRLAG